MGTNLPHRGLAGAALLARAAAELRSAGLAPLALSGVWETPAWPESTQPNYFNAAAEIDTGGLVPQMLYQKLLGVELRFGRKRGERWGPRTLDLDIIAMDGFLGRHGEICLPHKHMHERGFVLAPLAEIAPHWRHPSLDLTVAELLAAVALAARGRRVGELGGRPPNG
jgi:2-amino-4-hydroxy-6-hydroxymethyldihydropteridine diphosphokinase